MDRRSRRGTGTWRRPAGPASPPGRGRAERARDAAGASSRRLPLVLRVRAVVPTPLASLNRRSGQTPTFALLGAREEVGRTMRTLARALASFVVFGLVATAPSMSAGAKTARVF